MSSSSILTLTDDNFSNEVLTSPVPVLVDFWAEWCGPCKMISPIIDELAQEYQGKVRFGKVNVDEHQTLAAQYGIRAIPTLLLFKGGEITDQIVGMKSKRDFKEKLDTAIG